VEKDENKDVIEQCKQVRQVSARCLNEGCHKTSAMRGTVTPFRLVMTDWEVAAEFEAEALEKGNKSAEAVMVLSDFGNHIIPLAMKEDQQEHERARFLASTAWIKCMKILKHTDQNGLSEPFTAALGSFPDTNNNPEFEQVRITLQLARAMINSNVPQQSLDNALGVIEHNADNPAIGKAVLYFTSYMKAPEQYDYLQKLLTLYRTHPEYNPSASVYWSAGLNASVLGRKDEAIQIFVEFLQKFPKDTLRNEVEEELRNLRQKQTDNK
jgi:tetratricopeptide (TPR) repeat protein